MIIERDTRRFVVVGDESIDKALRRITSNQNRTVCVIDSSGYLLGVIADGDVRRWLIDNPGESLETQCARVANRHFTSRPVGTPYAELDLLFSPSILIVPLTDDHGRLVAIARPHTRGIWINSRQVDQDSPTYVIAEIGINHNGSLDTAKRLIDIAAESEADGAKFQMRDMQSLYRNSDDPSDHREDLGPQYTLDLLERFSLTTDEMIEAFDYCKSVNITPLCTPWDLESARILSEYQIPAFKVASADLTNHDLLSALAETGRPLIMSTGMSSENEILGSVNLLRDAGAGFVLLHCNSTYPAPFKDVNLRYMKRLAELGDCLVGYSGHERGRHVAVAAVAMGARVIEKHITLDRTSEGNDHKVSLEAGEFSLLVQEIRSLEEALGTDKPRMVTQGEMMNRVNLAKSIVAKLPIASGQRISEEHLEIRSPGRGLQPNRRGELIGRIVSRDLEPGDFFFESDLMDSAIQPRSYKFRRPWGLPVRYHDYRDLAVRTNPDLLEFHMSYRDLDLAVSQMITEPVSADLVVHSPELFAGDHLLNLASDDDVYWHRSIDELQRVVETTRELQPMFDTHGDTLIITNVGGFSSDGPRPPTERPRLYERIAEGLSRVDTEGVEVIAQTMPPFPWLFGGQRFHNVFVDPEDTISFIQTIGMRLCLDVAHTKLACSHRRRSFSQVVELFAPLAAHLHIVDAAGVDDEGLQIGEGEVDFGVLAEQLDRLAPTASFIPEIWQGHQNLGEGFWVALDRLEKYL